MSGTWLLIRVSVPLDEIESVHTGLAVISETTRRPALSKLNPKGCGPAEIRTLAAVVGSPVLLLNPQVSILLVKISNFASGVRHSE